MPPTEKPGNAKQNDDTKSLNDTREDTEQPAGEFATEEDAEKIGKKDPHGNRR